MSTYHTLLTHLLKSYCERGRSQLWQVILITFNSSLVTHCSGQSSTSASHLPNKRSSRRNFRRGVVYDVVEAKNEHCFEVQEDLIDRRTHKRGKKLINCVIASFRCLSEALLRFTNFVCGVVLLLSVCICLCRYEHVCKWV